MFQLFTLPLALYAFWRRITQVFTSMTIKVPEFTMLLNSSKAPMLLAENIMLFLLCHIMTYPLTQPHANIIILRIYVTDQGAKLWNRLFQYPKYWCHQLINILLLKVRDTLSVRLIHRNFVMQQAQKPNDFCSASLQLDCAFHQF
jgi:hypothetical protein